MLVKLTSSTSGEIIMFAQQARRLFEIMDKECTARGVFTKEQLPEAIARLQRAVEEEATRRLAEAERAKPDKDDDRDEDEAGDKSAAAISLSQRAHPLIQMMQWTQKEEGFVLWQADRDF